MTGKQQRNIEGKLVTRHGKLDRRAQPSPALNPVAETPEYVYDTLHKPGDSRPWHVWETNLSNGLRRQVSRHSNEAIARKRAELERLRLPQRRATTKALHKAGIDQRQR